MTSATRGPVSPKSKAGTRGDRVRALSWGAFMRVLADGRRALSESRDKTLRLWDLETGAEISCLTFDAVPSTLAWSERMEVAVVRDGLGLMHFVELAGWTPVDVPEH
jgi:hypothetical protein